MPHLNQKGVIAQVLILLLLAVGLAVGIYLVQTRTNLLPKASVSGPITPVASFTLDASHETFYVGSLIPVKVDVRSDIAAANLFTAKINFDKDSFAVDKIDVSDSFVKSWIENNFDNTAGTISLIGGVPNPGYQTDTSQPSSLMAVIYLKALKTGAGSIIPTNDSAIYSNADNLNILTVKQGAVIQIGSGTPQPTAISTVIPSATPVTVPTPTSTPVPGPKAGSGDGNNDGKIDIVDLSVLLSDFNKIGNFRTMIDINGDGKINSFDFSLMKNLLIQKKVIKD